MKDQTHILDEANKLLYEKGYIRSKTSSDHLGIFSLETGNRIGPEIPIWRETKILNDFIIMDLTEETIISCLTEWYLQQVSEWTYLIDS